MAVRYAAKTPDQIRSREVEKTSVGAWSTVLVVTFETDPAVLASVLPRPLEPSSTPLVKVTFATVDI
ncbi:MAG TPA: acetoacetate decarboxylase family protein, partial [Acidimicrobiales bacterium]